MRLLCFALYERAKKDRAPVNAFTTGTPFLGQIYLKLVYGFFGR